MKRKGGFVFDEIGKCNRYVFLDSVARLIIPHIFSAVRMHKKPLN